MEDVSDQVMPLEAGQEVRVCPACDYCRGFHLSLVRSEDDPKRLEQVLICPGCGGRYRVVP